MGRVARDPECDQVLDCLSGPLRRQRTFANQTPQYLGRLHIEQVHRVQSFVARVNPLLNALSSRGEE